MADIKSYEKENDVFFQIGKHYNENIKLAGQAPFDLFKGMKNGASIEELYLIAVKGLAACTGDSLLVTTAENFVKEKTDNIVLIGIEHPRYGLDNCMWTGEVQSNSWRLGILDQFKLFERNINICKIA